MIIINRIKMGIAISIGVFFTSCDKLISITPPSDSITSNEVFSNDKAVQTAVTGLYVQMALSSFATSYVNIYSSLSGDDVTYSGTASAVSEFADNSLEATNSLLSPLWSYGIIYQANSIITGLNENPLINPELKDVATGTAKFIRAFYYFYLANMFGDVPLVLSPDYTKSATMSRTSTPEVYQQIETDLNDAINLLPSALGSQGKGLLSSWAAKALLARVYLYEGNWEKAKLLSTEVIESGIFHLEPDLEKVFLSNSQEAIWQLAPTDGSGVFEAILFVPYGATKPNYPISGWLSSSFESYDKRFSSWIGQTTVTNIQYFYPYKYRQRDATTTTEYLMVLRFAEQYLIRAEAEAQLNNISAALSDIDSIRNRAGLKLLSSESTVLDQSDVLSLIEIERRHELFCEWGHRWFDLKRTKRADAVLGAEKVNWERTDQLFPIYYQQLIYNKALIQNPGYTK